MRLLAQVEHLEPAEAPAARAATAATAEHQALAEGAALEPMVAVWEERRLSEAPVERWQVAEPWERAAARAAPLAQEAAQPLQVGRCPVAVPATRAEADRVAAARVVVAQVALQVAALLRRVAPPAVAAGWGPAAVTPG